MSDSALERFREIVLDDDSLQAELRDILDREAFISRVVELGGINGCRFGAGDVEDALRQSRRIWFEIR